MISCPLCGAKTRVTETRATATSARRRRVCLDLVCTGKVTTVELVVPDGLAHAFSKGSVLVEARQLAKLHAIVAALEGVKL